MIHWLVLLVCILIVCSLLIFVGRKPNHTEGYGDFYDRQNSYQSKQGVLYHDTKGKEILTNAGINLSVLNDAIQQPELYLPKTGDRDYKPYLQEDPHNAFTEKDKSLCRGVKSPLLLPKREKGARIGCGWWYVSNPSVNSVGALGTFQSAMFPETLPINGEWMWNLDLANKKEKIKFCKTFKSCDALAIPEVKQKCAFCSLKGHMIPVTLDGMEIYPDDPDGSCGSELIYTQEECNRPPLPEPMPASNGVNCGNLGVPSPDNAWRKYTQEECDSLGGNFANGECLIKTGGSFSWDCRSLNIPAVAKPKPITVCTPNSNGSLSLDCKVSTAVNLGYSKQGGYLMSLTNSQNTAVMNSYAIVNSYQDLRDFLGFTIDRIDRDGDAYVSLEVLIRRLYTIFTTMKHASIMLSGYCKWLVNGSELPDACMIDPAKRGPFEVRCLQQAFRMAGCQASGEAYPSNKTRGIYTGSWDSVNAYFRNLFTSMKSGEAAIQDEAVKNCLGIEYYRAAPPDDSFESKTNMDRYGADIKCVSGLKPDECRKQCINDPRCKAYNVWPKKAGCCLKTSSEPLRQNKGVTINIKKPISYEFYQGSDSPGSDLTKLPDKNIEAMIKWCDENPACKGFNHWGYMKNNISPKIYWNNIGGDSASGLYVKTPKYLGCFKDTGDRAVPTLRNNFNKDLFKECAKAATAAGDDTFSLQNGNQCFTGKAPAYDKYGAAIGCQPNGGGWTNQVYKLETPYVDLDKKPYTYIGCFKDTGNRAIPDPKNVVSGDKAASCAKIAMSKGHNIFAVQNGNECFTGKDSEYDKYGSAGGCQPDGGPWTNQVYVMGDKIPPKKAKYTKRANADSGGNDIGCFQNGESADFCKAKCDADPKCMGYNYVRPNGVWGKKSGCCYKKSNLNLKGATGIDYYLKETTNDSGYKYQPNVDHGGSDLGCMGGSVSECRQRCDADPRCKAIIYIHPNTFWGGASGCCFKDQSSINSNMNGLDFWTK